MRRGRGPQRSASTAFRLPRLLPGSRQHDGPATPGLRHPGRRQRPLLRGLLPRSGPVSGPRLPPPPGHTGTPPGAPRVCVRPWPDTWRWAGAGGPSSLQEGKKGRPNRAAPALGPSLTPRAQPGRAWLGHVGQGTRATTQRSESTCRTGRIRGDQTVWAELLAAPHPTPDARAAASCEQTGWKRQEDGSRPGWRAPGRFLEEGSDRVSKSEELLWERKGAWLGKVGVQSDRERCPGQYREALSAQGTGTGPLSPDPRETRSRAVWAVVAG